MPLLDNQLQQNQEIVLNIIRSLQSSTRKLQHICTHSKSTRDASLMRFVPTMKKCLESLVFRVKAMLVINGSYEAFWMGNLKNRDLKGNEIMNDTSRMETDDDRSDTTSVTTNNDDNDEDETVAEEENEVIQSDVELDEDATNVDENEEDDPSNLEGITEFSVSF